MTILRSGSTKKYSDNWAAAFGKGKKGKTSAAKSATKNKRNVAAKKRKTK